MHRSKGRRGPAARILGWGLVAVVYATVLVWAGGLTAGETVAAADEAGAVAGAIVAVPAEMSEELATVAEIATPAEAPLVTVAIAAGMVLVAAGWYATHTYRQRQPRLRRARLIVRHITTLL